MSPSLEIYLLGAPAIKRQRTPIFGLATRKAEALLYYLAVTEQTVERAEMASLLWPGKPLNRARKNLRDAVGHIRKAGLHEYLDTTSNTISLPASADIYIDVTDFRASLPKACNQLSQEQAENLAETLRLYSGDFLTGFTIRGAPEFDDWAAIEREALFRLAIQHIGKLIESYRQQDNPTAALEWCDRMLTLEPWNGEANRTKIEIMAAQGERSAAIRHYVTYDEILLTEFDSRPDSATQRLNEAIRSGSGISQPSFPTEFGDTPRNSLAKGLTQGTPKHHKKMASEGNQYTNLAPSLTTFVGREKELTYLLDWLQRGAKRLLTVVGPGGIGKTRVVYEAAERAAAMTFSKQLFADGIFFVPLADVLQGYNKCTETISPTEVIQAIMATMIERMGIRFSGQVLSEENLFSTLKSKQLLLILDNFEHLLASAPFVNELLEACPRIRIIITSQDRLYSKAEEVYVLQGLECQSTERLYSEAVTLFSSRAALTNCPRSQSSNKLSPHESPEENTPHIARICHLVGGMPLAIELAASLANHMTLSDIVLALEEDLQILQNKLPGMKSGHHSIVAVLNESWQRANQKEQSALERLSIFSDGFTLEAAQKVANVSEEMLYTLIGKSFLLSRGGRFAMHELVRRFTREQLARDQVQQRQVQEAHRRYFTDYLHQQLQAWTTTYQRKTLDEIAQDTSNLLAAWHSTLAREDITQLSPLIDDLWLFYRTQSWASEAIAIIEQAQKLAARIQPSSLSVEQARWLFYLSELQYDLGQLQESNAHALDALRLLNLPFPREKGTLVLKAIGAASGRLSGLQQQPLCPVSDEPRIVIGAKVYARIAFNSYLLNENPSIMFSAIHFANLTEQLANGAMLPIAYAYMSIIYTSCKLQNMSRRYSTLALSMAQQMGDGSTLAAVNFVCGTDAVSRGNLREAQISLEAAQLFYVQSEDWIKLGDCICMLNIIAVLTRNYRKGHEYGQELEALANVSHNRAHRAWGLIMQGAIGVIERTDEAIANLERALPLAQHLAAKSIGLTACYASKAHLHYRQGDFTSAHQLLHKTVVELEKINPTSVIYLYAFDILLETLIELWVAVEASNESKPALMQTYRRLTKKLLRMLSQFSWFHAIAKPFRLLYRGHYLWNSGEYKTAYALWIKGLRLAESHENPSLIGRFHYQLGRTLPPSDPQRLTHLGTAQKLFAQAEMVCELERVNQAITKTR
ncbi:MAG: BTAD domain-containing putative transcriptional regulator [Chloroflexota bacterium]